MIKKNIIPEGMKDLLYEECDTREFIKNKVQDVFYRFGYDEIVTPSIEFLNTFKAYKNYIKEEEVYKFFDREGRILSLKPDVTIPIARVVGSKMKSLDLPIRLKYTSNTFRMNKSLKGRQNENLESGIELIGRGGISGDIEVLIIAIEGIKSIGLDDFKIEIGNINFFKKNFYNLGLSEDIEEKLASLLESKSLNDLNLLLDKLDITKEKKDFLKRMPWLFGGVEVLDDLLKDGFSDDIKKEIIYLKNIYKYLEDLGYSKYISFDLGMVPRVNYYTGIIFRSYIDGVSKSILNGGRYDNLIKEYGRDAVAIGFSFDLDLISNNYSLKINKEEEIIEIKDDFIDSFKKGIKSFKEGKRIKFLKN